jgi:prepilin-type N-terminal cleavage/methylation domain-containing protein
MQIVKKQSGLTFVEILAALAIGSILMLSMTGILRILARKEKNSTEARDFNSLASVILAVANPNCTSSTPFYFQKSGGTAPNPLPTFASSGNAIPLAFYLDTSPEIPPVLGAQGQLINDVYYQLQLEPDNTTGLSMCPSVPATVPPFKPCFGKLWLSTVHLNKEDLGLKTSRRMIAGLAYYAQSTLSVCPPSGKNQYLGWNSGTTNCADQPVSIPTPTLWNNSYMPTFSFPHYSQFQCPSGKYMTANYASFENLGPSAGVIMSPPVTSYPAAFRTGNFLSPSGFRCCSIQK